MYIKREDAIETIDTMICDNKWVCECAINSLPTTDDNWIPVSERLPQCGVGMHYLVTLKDGHCFKDDVYEAFFDKNGWHMGYNELADDDVIAWMPLPTPYKESEVQNESRRNTLP